MAEKPEPTREQIAQEYARALVIINRLRTRNMELLDLLQRTVRYCPVEVQDQVYAVIEKAEGL